MCEQCATQTKVINSRRSKHLFVGGHQLNVRGVNRRRECLVCGARFTTYELQEKALVDLIERSIDAQKVPEGLLRRVVSLEKRVGNIELNKVLTF